MCIALPAALFIAAWLLRGGTPLGADGFGYALGAENIPQNTPYLAFLLFSALPASILLRQAMLFALLAAFCWFTYQLGKPYCQKHAVLLPLIVFSTPLLFIKFSELENDVLGYVFLPLIWMFFLKARESHSKKDYALCLALIAISSLFWHGNVLFLLAFVISPIFLIFLIGLVVLKGPDLLAALKPLENVGESTSILGLAHLFLLIPGFFALPKHAKFPALIFLIMAMVNARYAVFLLPILAVGVVRFIEKHEEKIREATKKVISRLFKNNFPFKNYAGFNLSELFVTLASIMFVYVIVYSPNFQPDRSQYDAVQFAVKEANGKEIGNDWSFCYWTKYYGGKTECEQAPSPLKIREITLTEKKLKAPCAKLKSFGAYAVYRC